MAQRDNSIDILKSFFVVPMILCHVLQFFSNDPEIFAGTGFFMELANIQTFSGFVFCFGYTTYIAYLSKEFKQVRKKMIITFLKSLFAFYISGVAFITLVNHQRISFKGIMDVILLNNVPGWSEFLASFALFVLVAFVLFKPIKLLLERKKLFAIVTTMLLLTTFIPYSLITVNQIGLFIGTTNFAVFPILQYMPFYLLGMYVCRYGMNKIILFTSLGLSAISLGYILFTSSMPGRFPPTLLWIILPTGLIALYYLAAKWIATQKMLSVINNFLSRIGSNTMSYLLLSNIIIFAIGGSGTMPRMGLMWGFFTTFIITAIIYYLVSLTVKPFSKSKTLETKIMENT